MTNSPTNKDVMERKTRYSTRIALLQSYDEWQYEIYYWRIWFIVSNGTSEMTLQKHLQGFITGEIFDELEVGISTKERFKCKRQE